MIRDPGTDPKRWDLNQEDHSDGDFADQGSISFPPSPCGGQKPQFSLFKLPCCFFTLISYSRCCSLFACGRYGSGDTKHTYMVHVRLYAAISGPQTQHACNCISTRVLYRIGTGSVDPILVIDSGQSRLPSGSFRLVSKTGNGCLPAFSP